LSDSRKRILVIQALPGIGDMVWHVPFIRAICRFENVKHVDILAEKRSMADQIFATEGLVSEAIWLDEFIQGKKRLRSILRLAKLLRSKHYQCVWILHYSFSWALAAFLAGIPSRYGYGLGSQHLLLNGKHLGKDDAALHPIDKAIKVLQLNGLPITDIAPSIPVSATELSSIEDRFKDCPKPWIAFGIGATDQGRQWGIDNFTDLAKLVANRFGGTIFLLAGPAEAAMAGQIKNAMTAENSVTLVPVIAYPIRELSALLKMSNFFIGNDSGMLNLSAAVGTPSIGLLGMVYRSIDNHRIADEKRNIYAVFPNDKRHETGREFNVSYMHLISVASVGSKLQQLFEKHPPNLMP
jgi:heptosyltransferase-2